MADRTGLDEERRHWVEQTIATTQEWIERTENEARVELAFSAPVSGTTT